MCVVDDFVLFVFVFLVADVLFGRVGTGGVESDEREIQERASEMHRLSPSYPNYLSFWVGGIRQALVRAE